MIRALWCITIFLNCVLGFPEQDDFSTNDKGEHCHPVVNAVKGFFSSKKFLAEETTCTNVKLTLDVGSPLGLTCNAIGKSGCINVSYTGNQGQEIRKSLCVPDGMGYYEVLGGYASVTLKSDEDVSKSSSVDVGTDGNTEYHFLCAWRPVSHRIIIG